MAHKEEGDEYGSSEEKLIAKARDRAKNGRSFWSNNWEKAKDDLIFLSGNQWPDNVKTERELDQRPCLTNNVLPTFVDQILGDQRQNRPAIKVNPVDFQVNDGGASDKIENVTGKQDYDYAQVFTGLIKNIEYNCDAETSYDIAFQAAVESGIGFLRVRHDFVDGGFDQDVIIDHIENQFAVIMDPAAKERDYSDMNWCIINDQMDKKKFEKLYPDSQPAALEADYQNTDMVNWYQENTVTVSEYFTREEYDKKLVKMSDGTILCLTEEVEKVLDELKDGGITVVEERTVKAHKVIWRKITGHDVLEGPIEFPTSTIPVVPVWGKAITVKGETTFMSLIRHSKDAQRMANYWESAATEAIALAPKAPFIATVEQIEGYEEEWQSANKKNHSVLPYNKDGPGDRGPMRQQPAMPATAEMAMGQSSVDKIKSTVGMFDASIGATGNETSGRAILARQSQGDRGSYAFIDNLSKSIRRVGKLCVEMIPKIYDTERQVRVQFQDDTEDFVTLNKMVQDEETGDWVAIHDLGIARYDVVVSTGPAYQTQRQEAAESMMQFMKAVPQAAPVIGDLVAKNMDWPGADAISERLKKMLPPGMLSQEAQEELAKDAPPPAPPTPEQQAEMATAEADMAKAQAEMAKAEATSVKAQADVQIAELRTAEAQANAVTAQAAGPENVRELVAEAIAEIMAQNTK